MSWPWYHKTKLFIILQKLKGVGGGCVPHTKKWGRAEVAPVPPAPAIYDMELSSLFFLTLNHTVQKDSRGVLGTRIRVERASEIVANVTNME